MKFNNELYFCLLLGVLLKFSNLDKNSFAFISFCIFIFAVDVLGDVLLFVVDLFDE
jgi:hypothetical protein